MHDQQESEYRSIPGSVSARTNHYCRLTKLGLIQKLLRPIETDFEKVVAEDVPGAVEQVPRCRVLLHLEKSFFFLEVDTRIKVNAEEPTRSSLRFLAQDTLALLTNR